MRSSLDATVSQRVRHWAVAAVAALVATVWVVMTLIVPSQAETARAAEGSMNVNLIGSHLAPGVHTDEIQELPRKEGYHEFKVNTLSAKVTEEQSDYLGRRLPAWAVEIIRSADFLNFRDKFIRQKHGGGYVRYADNSKGYCIEPNVPGANGNMGHGSVSFVHDDDMPHQAKAMAGNQGYLPFVVEPERERALKALAAIYNANPNAYTDIQWQGAIWMVGTVYEVTARHDDDTAKIKELVARAQAEAKKFETNSELLKSIKLQIVDGKPGHKLVKLTGSEQAKEALRRSESGMASTIKVQVNGKEVSGTVAQALGDGIDVEVACEAGTATVTANWEGAISLSGTYAMQIIGRDQVKFIPGHRDVRVSGHSEVVTPCAPPTTPPVVPPVPEVPEKPTTPPVVPPVPETPTTPVVPPAPEKGRLVIAKKAVAPEGLSLPKTFDFTYACGDDEARTVKVAPGSSVRIDDIVAGTTCVVREAAHTVEGVERALAWKINGAPAGAEALVDGGVRVTVGANEDVTAEATNTFTRPVGQVRISKRVVDPSNLANGHEFGFPYVCATGSAANTLVGEGTLRFGANGQGVIKDIPAGATCVIGETDAAVEGATLATTWTVDGQPRQAAETTWGGVTLSGVKTAAVAKDVTIEVAATNSYIPEDKAGFVVTKQVTGVDGTQLAGRTFDFDYSCQADRGMAQTGQFQLAAGAQFSSIEQGVKLAPGTRCVVTERKPATIPGVEYKGVTFNRTAGTGEFTSDQAASRVTFVVGADPVLFTAVNAFAPEKPVEPEAKTILGTVDGGKTIKADEVGDSITLVDTIRYTNLVAGTEYVADGRLIGVDGTDVRAHATFTPEGEEGQLVSGTVEVTFEVPGDVIRQATSLTAFEKIWLADKVTISGNTVEPKVPGDKPAAKHEVPDDKDQTVTVTPPTPKPTPVKLSLTKIVEGKEAADRAFAFTLDCDGQDSRQVSVRAGAREVIEANPGTVCRLSENTADAAIDGVTPQLGFAGEGVDVTVAEGVATFTVPAGATESTVVVTAKNTYPAPEKPAPEIGTIATNENAAEGDNGKTIPVGRDGIIRDVMTWKNLEPGDYIVVPSLKRAAGTAGESVAGVEAAPVAFTVAEGQQEGEVVAKLTVPATQIVPGAKFVVFERVYRAEDVTSEGVIENAVPVATHEDINDPGQTIETLTPPIVPSTLVIEKVARDAEGEPVDGEFSFDLTCKAGRDTIEKKGLKVRTDARTAPIEVPAGAQCTLVEDAESATVKDTQPTLSFATNDANVVVSEEGMTGTFTMPTGDSVNIIVKATNTYPEWTVPPAPETPTTPPTPDKPTPDKPVPPKPDKPTPDKPTTPCVPPVPAEPDKPTPDKPTTPTPDKPTPNKPVPSNPEKPVPPMPEWCYPQIATVAKNAHTGTSTVNEKEIVTIVDTVNWKYLAPGEYVVNGVLVDKQTGLAVPGQAQKAVGRITVTEWRQSGTVEMVVTVPAGVLKQGESYVMFERVHKASDTDEQGRPKLDENGVEVPAVVTHASIDDAAQTVVAGKPKKPTPPGTPPATPPATPDKPTPNKPVPPKPDKPTPNQPVPPTPDKPEDPCDVPPRPNEPNKPGEPGEPNKPGEPGEPNKPGEPSTPDTPGVPEECLPRISTSAVDAADGDKVLAQGVDARVTDRVSYVNFAEGSYVIMGWLMDKATGSLLEGSHMVAPKTVTVESGRGSGTVDIEFTVPADRAKSGATWVVFERAYRAEDIDPNGNVREGATPYVTHEDLNDAAQTVTVIVPAKPGQPTPPGVVPPRPGIVTPPAGLVVRPRPPLARTGVEAGVVGIVSVSVIVAGLGLVALRRREASMH